MMLSSHQMRYLKLMGISLWCYRQVPTSSKTPTNAQNIEGISHQTSAAERELALLPPSTPTHAPNLEMSSSNIGSMDWETLHETVSGCRLCALCEVRTKTVFGTGAKTADWMIIGEAPGVNEDAQGEPFVGRAGQLLNSMLGALGLTREEVFIANTLKCRPPGNRDPSREETVTCGPYLVRQIELLNPRVILAVGRIAAQTLLETEQPLGRLRARVHRYPPTNTPLVVTYHPAYLLRSPGQKKSAWQDLKFARQTAKEYECPARRDA